ncbi:MAG: gamma-glutamyl-gamma-aminobutyrate hydrolase family protein [Lachnospiraceae bacterium]|nr:gamma-glutamyl-gamma-aminobutyrate hydrolase family protein [Lachnospiraceae bacterium]
MLKPVIGVMPLWDDEKESIWMLPGYFSGISRAGGLPLMLPFTKDEGELDQLFEMCDGFLFTGGHDVSPEIYGEKPLEGLVASCKKRDEMESAVLRKAIEKDKPVLGICRGIQFINAKLGGTLYQDLPLQHPSETDHHQKPPYDIPVHEVDITEDSPLYKCLGEKKIRVNSYHHQAVKDVAPGLEIMAVSEDGLVEGLYLPKHRFLWAVQWHPEFSFESDENSQKIFGSFVDSCR